MHLKYIELYNMKLEMQMVINCMMIFLFVKVRMQKLTVILN